jgi:hypothetical protein
MCNEEKEFNIKNTVDKLFSLQTNNFIFIYTPPKVGSTTLVSSLRISLGKSYNVIHIHDDIMLSVLTGINNITVNEIINYLGRIGKKVYVLDVYRTPIERKMSEYFEKLAPYHFNNSEENLKTYSLKRITDRFNKLFIHLSNGDHYFNKYDILEEDIQNFDFINKYTLQQINNVNYIKLRLCDSKIWANILSKIFNEDIVLIDDYQMEKKPLGELYKRFKEEYKLPLNYFEVIKNDKYFNFYYSHEEKNKYLNSIKIGNNIVPYSDNEYNFYVNLYLENQHINDIQIDHYIDNGCFCDLCNKKRHNIYLRAKSGEKIFEKIIHTDIINKEIENRNKYLVMKIKEKVHILRNNQRKKKYKQNQFNINL